MTGSAFLTTEEVSERYRRLITVGTLENWRALRIGPSFMKVGKAVLYPVAELDAWDSLNIPPNRTVKSALVSPWRRTTPLTEST
jgi:hypothetical protein